MKLSTNDLALLDQINSVRVKVRDQYMSEHFNAQSLLKELLGLSIHIEEEPKAFQKMKEQNLDNITKLMGACFSSSENAGKFRVSASVFSECMADNKEPNRPNTVSEVATIQQDNSNTMNRHQSLGVGNQLIKMQPWSNKPDPIKDKGGKQAEIVGFTAASKLIKKEDKPKNNQTEKIPQQIAASKSTDMGKKKFVPPFKKAEEPPAPEIQQKQEDPRYKNIDKALIQMIESEILENGKQVRWSDIAGLGFAKRTIHQMIVWPMLRPDIFTGLRAPPKGVLLFGPPGTGKTLIGKAIAHESKSTFFSISASSLTSKWVGEGQKLVKVLFLVAQVRQPSVIFIDEIDSLLCARSENDQESSRRIKTEFLVQLDGAKGNPNDRILIIGATNRPQELDEAVRRRFVKRLYIPLPDKTGRSELIKTLAKEPQFKLSQSDIEAISKLTKGYSGADLHSLCSEASLIPVRNMMSNIVDVPCNEVPSAALAELKQGLSLVKPSVNSAELGGYEQWNRTFGSYQIQNSDD